MQNHGDFFHEAKYTDQNGVLQTTKIPVVQELARKGITNLPERFISLPQGQQKCSVTAHVSLPTIDLLKLRNESSPSRNEELGKVAGAAKEWGMFLVSNHGVHDSVLDSVKDVVRGFFGLSFEEKKNSVGSYMSTDNMGYGRNFVRSENQALDWIDRMSMVAFPVDDGNLHVWPKKPHNFREVMVKYAAETRIILDDLLQAMAEALSLDKNAFLKNFEPERSELKIRTNYYPPCPRPDLAVGLTPHSDASGLSLLIQFGAENGLQVLKDQKWVSPIWPGDMLLVNIGDLMEIMSNGRLTSSWHRAITSTGSERFSVAVFYNPPPDAEIEPMQDENSSDGMYRKVSVKEYVEHYYKVSPTVDKEAIMYAKVV
ncbi:protein SRG1-like [Apium graveolens]|uniref:protein SRG1-like n=1 Tax=Apium graveolens TaxID=4045 RepID=UPI003D7B45DD